MLKSGTGICVRSLTKATKATIRRTIADNLKMGVPADLELTYVYVVSLLENQYPEFWELDETDDAT